MKVGSTDTPPVARSTAKVTPSSADVADDSLYKRMSVEKGVVDELLLVCGVIGSTVTSDENQLIPVTDCLNWLQDLQRALRRDDDTYRPISLLIGKWRVVQQKLLPLVMTCRYDSPMVLTIVKILVILTKPLSETTKRAGRIIIDTMSGKVPESIIREQIRLRDNALEQSDMLMEYKRAIAHHSSHILSKSSTTNKDEKRGGILSTFVSLLAEPLSKTGTDRTDTDHLTIELVLHLFRNLLSAEPILKSSTETSQRSAQLHHELICLFDRELVLDILVIIAQDMESRENAQYNLLMMELLNHLLRAQDPTTVARSIHIDRKAAKRTAIESIAKVGFKKARLPGSLFAQLQREKQKLLPKTTSRHSHFGGTLVINRCDGKRQYVSATLADQCNVSQSTAKKRKNRRTDPFIGSGRTSAAHTRAGGVASTDDGPASLRAQQTLYKFCGRFISDCYGPMMKSLKNEFRRDSARLEEGDKVVFFRIVWFFCQWWRVAGKGGTPFAPGNDNESPSALRQLIFTMDVFTFNLVLNSTDTFFQHKKYTQLAQAVALYSEMMQLLNILFQSKDSTENIMALGLLDRLYYGSEPLDRLPKLLSKWAPGTQTREYLCDLVELCHVTLKILEANAKACTLDDETEEGKKKNDAVARMKATAAEFDLSSYIARKIVSNQMVFMYTHLLSQFLINAPHINHHIIAFLVRLSKLLIVASDDDEERNGSTLSKNELAIKNVTLEPMLYNIQLFLVLDQILNDASIQKDKEYAALIEFAANLMGRFARKSETNPMLLVECLFRHPIPHRFCELSTNMYVSEELRMIAERELLLEEQRRLAASEDMEEAENDDEVDEFDEYQFGDETPQANGTQLPSDPISNVAEDGEESMSSKPHLSMVDDKTAEEADSEDDDRWSDRRPFLPKGAVATTDVNESTPRLTVDTSASRKRQRIQKISRSDVSDDEVEFGFESGPALQASDGVARSRLVIDDDDDDDDT